MQELLGRPVEDALRCLPEGQTPPRVVETAAPVRNGQGRQGGVLRILSIRENEWIAARFMDAVPQEKEEA